MQGAGLDPPAQIREICASSRRHLHYTPSLFQSGGEISVGISNISPSEFGEMDENSQHRKSDGRIENSDGSFSVGSRKIRWVILINTGSLTVLSSGAHRNLSDTPYMSWCDLVVTRVGKFLKYS